MRPSGLRSVSADTSRRRSSSIWAQARRPPSLPSLQRLATPRGSRSLSARGRVHPHFCCARLRVTSLHADCGQVCISSELPSRSLYARWGSNPLCAARTTLCSNTLLARPLQLSRLQRLKVEGATRTAWLSRRLRPKPVFHPPRVTAASVRELQLSWSGTPSGLRPHPQISGPGRPAGGRYLPHCHHAPPGATRQSFALDRAADLKVPATLPGWSRRYCCTVARPRLACAGAPSKGLAPHAGGLRVSAALV